LVARIVPDRNLLVERSACRPIHRSNLKSGCCVNFILRGNRAYLI